MSRRSLPLLAAPLLLAGLASGPFADAPEAFADDAEPESLSTSLSMRFDRLWASAHGEPGPRCDDTTFLRRLFLDVRGRIPRPEELGTFLADSRSDKRRRAIEAALAAPEHARLIARRRARRILAADTPGPARAAFERGLTRLYQSVPEAGTRQAALLGFQGITPQRPLGLFLAQFRGRPDDTAAAVSRAFLGLSLDCARCHDHPFERWTRADFHGLAAAFARVRVRPRGNGSLQVSESPVGDYHAKVDDSGRARPIVPRMPDGATLAAGPGADQARPSVTSRRQALLDWLQGDGAALAARARAQRIVHELCGIALVGEGPESLPPPGSDPALLTALTEALRSEDLSDRELRRAILLSRSWQQQAPEAGVKDSRVVRAIQRPLDGEQFVGALLVALGRDRPREGEPEFLHRATVRRLRVELTAAQPDAGDVLFGSSVRAALKLRHSPVLDGLTRALPGRLLGDLLAEHPPGPAGDRAALTALVRRCLCRDPTDGELVRWLPLVSEGPRAEVYEDLFHALLCSPWFAARR